MCFKKMLNDVKSDEMTEHYTLLHLHRHNHTDLDLIVYQKKYVRSSILLFVVRV